MTTTVAASCGPWPAAATATVCSAAAAATTACAHRLTANIPPLSFTHRSKVGVSHRLTAREALLVIVAQQPIQKVQGLRADQVRVIRRYKL